MKRKVCKVGPCTLMVSLPSKWVRNMGIKQGDEMDVEEKDSGLLMSKNIVQKEKLITINVTKESKRYIRSQIGRLYRYGYTKICIIFDDPNLIKLIKDSNNNLIGADIIDLDNTKCVIKIFSIEDSSSEFDKYFIKIFQTLKYMLDIMREDINNNEFKREEILNELRNNNWKLKDYILRNAFLQKIPYEEFSILSTLLFAYEKIGTNLLGFYRMYLEETKRKINSKKIEHTFDKLNSFIDWFIKSISKKEAITHVNESKFRKEMRDYHIFLFNELHNDKTIDHPFLTIVYFIIELLDSTVSYISVYKNEYDKELE
ncbi:MAG: AbrB/MazE/SpoVT family DNA-binding domain-containing protein [Nanoarchaeota archaeon]|nr:AbrB/MazE/SpoVT family DNA-binding domain-containing protein [Nanoarchaeota archaeon]